MTIEVDDVEAKAQFSQLVEQAESGVEVVIARGGTPVARLVRMQYSDSTVEQALVELMSIRSRATTGPESLRELINEGSHR